MKKNEQHSSTKQLDKGNLKSKIGKYIPGQFFCPRGKRGIKLTNNNAIENSSSFYSHKSLCSGWGRGLLNTNKATKI